MKKYSGLFFLLIALTSCTVSKPPPPGIEVPGEDPDKTILPDRKTSPAVVNLLNSAREATKQGDYARAEVLLERTVRIEPRNAVLWHYLAKLRLHQGRYKDAIGLASKSSDLSRGDNRLRADNWRIIAHARYRSGDENGARKAQQNADRLSTE
jgi:Tfp pilus assembly protein PilF